MRADPPRDAADGRGSATLLEVEDLSVVFETPEGAVRAVDGVSYAVAAGESVAIVGESGSGKSVSALAVMGLLPARGARVSGRVRVEGIDLGTLDEESLRGMRGRRVAMIFQEPMTSLNPLLTIGRQLTEGMRLHLGLGRRAARERAVELLATVGIPEPARRLAQYPHHLSGGMRQRVMIAIALSCEPALIIADEPTTALDVTIQAQILELVKSLTERLGVGLVLITHDLGIVARYATRVNVMYAGRIVESAPTRALYAAPRHPYTIGLLGSLPHPDAARGQRLVPIEGQPPDLACLGPGCPYRPRCAFAIGRCARERPRLEPLDGDGEHRSACLRAAELDGSEDRSGTAPASTAATQEGRP